MKYLVWILKKLKVVKPEIYLAFRIVLILKKIIKLYIMETGIITKELAKSVSKKADADIDFSKIKVVGKFVEMFDDDIIYFTINFADDKWGEKVPEAARPALNKLLEAYASGNWENVDDEVVTAVNAWIDIPLLDEDFEGNLIHSFLTAIVKFIKSKKQ